MDQFIIKKYESQDFALWNDFVSNAKNATFLFHRNFMEYHSDRFSDFSLLIFKGEKLVSILPAHVEGDEVFSHNGLTYGGFVFNSNIKLEEVIQVFQSVLRYFHNNKILMLNIKLIPSIYSNYFSEELEYPLFLTNAKLYRRDCLSVIDLSKPFSFSKTRRECIRRGFKNNLEIKEESNFELFWNEILIPNLKTKHSSKPVHSLEEIKLLHQKFPNNIRQFNVYYQDKIVAGTTVFVTKSVIRPQYVSGNNLKNELGSLDFLYDYLISEISKGYQFFDFGPSHEDNGMKINKGILFWKESFGAKTTVQDFYKVETKNYALLNNILI